MRCLFCLLEKNITFYKSENFYFNLNLLLNIRELAKNTVSSTQVRFVMETGPVELKYFQF